MAALKSIIRTTRAVQNITKTLNQVSLSTNLVPKNTYFNNFLRCMSDQAAVQAKKEDDSTKEAAKKEEAPLTPTVKNLMQFFDDPVNWGQNRVKVGREWKKDELRIRSNEDLHKLWYILLKEKNMLLTMEHACKQEYEYFPNPERIDKVIISMENLEEVVRERNRAYYELETGEHGERPVKIVQNILGLRARYCLRQHFIPKFCNPNYIKRLGHNPKGNAVSKFLLLYREKLNMIRRREQARLNSEVKTILRRFPGVDEEAIKAKYPTVDLQKMKRISRTRGHCIPK